MVIVVAALLGGLLTVIPVGASLGLAYGGLLFIVVGVRGVRGGMRLTSKNGEGGAEVISGPIATRDMARRWRVAAVGNTVAGLILSALALAFLPVTWGIAVTLVMAAGILMTWHFERHIGAHRTGV